MTLAARLGRVSAALPARERALLFLRARDAGQEPDPELLRVNDEVERRALNGYLALVFVADSQLGAVLNVLQFHVERLKTDLHAFTTVQEAARVLTEELGEQVAKEKVRAWRKQESVTVPEFLYGLAGELKREVLEHALLRWRELRALEVVWEEIGTEFGGEDVVDPRLREQATETATLLRECIKELGGRRLPEPGDDFLQRTREVVEQAFTLLHLVEESK